jgi:hypothetical protein
MANNCGSTPKTKVFLSQSQAINFYLSHRSTCTGIAQVAGKYTVTLK